MNMENPHKPQWVFELGIYEAHPDADITVREFESFPGTKFYYAAGLTNGFGGCVGVYTDKMTYRYF